MLYRILRPFLFLLDPERAHQLALRILGYLPLRLKKSNQTPLLLWGLAFPNHIGLAPGWDKNGDCLDALLKLGFGFIEVGTVTPLPQEGNPKPRLFRLSSKEAVINRMGFNNKGVDYLVARLKARTVPGIVGVNIGKNKQTPNEKAHEDYLICLEKTYAYSDYITINISSPNTPGLRELQSDQQLNLLLSTLNSAREQLQQTHKKRVPLLIKISPDFPHELLEDFVNTVLNHSIDGIIATNTTLSRAQVAGVKFAGEAGGLSGKPLQKSATETIKAIKDIVGDRLPIIGVGGIDSPASAQEKLVAGATLLQVYTGLIYKGPELIHRLASFTQKEV